MTLIIIMILIPIIVIIIITFIRHIYDVFIFSLLAMGVDQFGHLPNKYVFVRDFMIPNKTTNQLVFRFKNLKSARAKRENAVKVKIDLIHACGVKCQ